jgi:hypothetical protein
MSDIAMSPVTTRRELPRFQQRISLGELRVSPFCLGIVGDWRAIPAAFELGINFFFVTTDMHWPLYEASRHGLEDLFASRPGIRDEIVVAGACYPTQPEFCVAPFRELVQALPGLERVDLLVAGGAYAADLIPRVNVLRTATRALGARAVGASFHDRRTAALAANHGLVDLCYVRYNPAHPGARTDLFPHLTPGKRPVFNFKSTMGCVPHDRLKQLNINPDLWYPTPPDYYRYALSRAQMDGLLFSVAEVDQLAALDEGMQSGGLTPEEEDHLDELARLTRQDVGVLH